jgi:hypothetical protein
MMRLGCAFLTEHRNRISRALLFNQGDPKAAVMGIATQGISR